MHLRKFCIAISLFAIAAFSTSAFAQGLNWEGQTGALITPFAYTAATPAHKFGKPEVSFHYLNAGKVIGNDYNFSVTEGICKHFEVGYTQSFSSAGSSPLTGLFANGYTALHGKLTFLPENSFKTKWVPAIAIGAVGRFGGQRVSYQVTGASSTDKNADFYIVATKTVTQVKGLPFVLSFGEKVTNASILGIAGNAGNNFGTEQRWQGRLFGAAAVVVKGPAKSALIFGSEVLQEPRYVQGLNDALSTETERARATIPTTLSYFVRIVPHLEGSPLQVDLAVVQAAGKITPGVDLNARARFATGVSYHF
jgi:hypothetical protein